MKKLMLSTMLMAFALAVQAGDSTTCQDKNAKDVAKPACCAKAKSPDAAKAQCCNQAKAKATCPFLAKTACCKTAQTKPLLQSPKASDSTTK